MKMFNDSQVVKMLKAAYKRGELAVGKRGEYYYATNGHWIIEIPPACTKLLAALLELNCLPEEEESTTVGPRKISTDAVLELYEAAVRADKLPTRVTSWLYETAGKTYRIVDADNKLYAFDTTYVRMFDDTHKPEVASLARQGGTKVLVYPFGLIIACRIKALEEIEGECLRNGDI